MNRGTDSPQALLFSLAEAEISLDHLPDVFGLLVCQTGQVQFSIHDAEMKKGTFGDESRGGGGSRAPQGSAVQQFVIFPGWCRKSAQTRKRPQKQAENGGAEKLGC